MNAWDVIQSLCCTIVLELFELITSQNSELEILWFCMVTNLLQCIFSLVKQKLLTFKTAFLTIHILRHIMPWICQLTALWVVAWWDFSISNIYHNFFCSLAETVSRIYHKIGHANLGNLAALGTNDRSQLDTPLWLVCVIVSKINSKFNINFHNPLLYWGKKKEKFPNFQIGANQIYRQ